MDDDRVIVTVRLLGDFRIDVDGHTLGRDDWPKRRAAELVQLLAITDRHWLPREQVMDALWPDLDPRAAGANLRKAAHHARRALGDDEAIVLSGGRVRLYPRAVVQTDMAAFEEAARQGLAEKDPRRCDEAVDRYGGTLLPSSRYEPWTTPTRTHLHRLYTSALAGAGRWEELLEVEPTDEAATSALMQARLERGDRHGAIRAYGRLRTALARSLGVAPSHEVEEIHQRCIADLASTDLVLVGRAEELATARAAALAARRGHVGLLTLAGPAGIGKSALLHAVEDTLGGSDWITATACAAATGESYAVLAALVDQLLGTDPTLLDTLSARARQVLATVSVMAGTADPPDRRLTRHHMAGALRQLVVAVGEPVALMVDDAHLADDATLEVLVHLASADAGAPSLAVLAHRDVPSREGLDAGVARLVRARRAVRVDIGPLAPDDVTALVEARAPDDTDREVVAEIVARADGNPFFALELVDGLQETGKPALTTNARQAVTRRMVTLDKRTVAMVERLAVAGDDLDLDDVEAMTGLSDAEVGRLLDQAIAAGVLHVSGSRYRFRHDLIRQALVEGLAPHQRQATHRDAARRLADIAGPPARIADHWLAGGRPEQAVPWLLEAGERALRVGAFVDARTHLDRLLAEVPDHPRALRHRAEALDALGDLQAPAAHGAAARVADEETAADIRAHQALAQVRMGDAAGCLDTLTGVTTSSLAGRVAEALARCGAVLLGVGSVDVAADRAEQARQQAIDHGDPRALTDASWALSLVAHTRRDLPGLLQRDLLATADSPGLAARVFDGYLCVTEAMLYGEQDLEHIVAFTDELASRARRIGATRAEAFAVTVRGEARLLADHLELADLDLARGAELHAEIGALGGRALALQQRAEVSLATGDHDRVDALLPSALAAARDSDLGQHLLDRIHGTRVSAARTSEEISTALEQGEMAIRGPMESCPPCRITFAVPAAIAAARIGDLERAEDHAGVVDLLTATIWADTGWAAAGEEVRGHLLSARGDHDGARRHFRRAIQRFEDSGLVRNARRCALAAGGTGTG